MLSVIVAVTGIDFVVPASRLIAAPAFKVTADTVGATLFTVNGLLLPCVVSVAGVSN